MVSRLAVCATFCRVAKREPKTRIAFWTAFEVFLRFSNLDQIVVALIGKVKRPSVENSLEFGISFKVLKQSRDAREIRDYNRPL